MKSETNLMESDQIKLPTEERYEYNVDSCMGHTVRYGIVYKVYPTKYCEDHSWLNDHNDAC